MYQDKRNLLDFLPPSGHFHVLFMGLFRFAPAVALGNAACWDQAGNTHGQRGNGGWVGGVGDPPFTNAYRWFSPAAGQGAVFVLKTILCAGHWWEPEGFGMAGGTGTGTASE